MKTRGFTLVEMIIGAAVTSILALAVFAVMNASMVLSAKNLSLNLTSNSLRSALDHVEQSVQMGYNMPTLVTASGAATNVQPAAGITFDKFLGSPYVVTVPGGGIPASTTVLTLTRSTDAVASPPIPRAGDIIRLATTASTLRPHIQSVVVGAVDAQLHQAFTITLTAALGTAVNPTSGTILTAEVIRNVAFIVVPNSGKQELRYYASFDATGDVNDVTKYAMVIDQIGSGTVDATPFTLTTYESKPFVSFSIRVRASSWDQGLRSQRDSFNTYNRVETLLRPKIIP